MLFQKVQQRYTRLINTIYFLVLLLTNHETPSILQLKNIMLSFHPPFYPITGLFTITTCCFFIPQPTKLGWKVLSRVVHVSENPQ